MRKAICLISIGAMFGALCVGISASIYATYSPTVCVVELQKRMEVHQWTGRKETRDYDK